MNKTETAVLKNYKTTSGFLVDKLWKAQNTLRLDTWTLT